MTETLEQQRQSGCLILKILKMNRDTLYDRIAAVKC